MVRIQPALKRLGFGRTQGYLRIQQGLLPRPIKIGQRAAALPEHEINEMAKACIAGANDDQLRALVQRLHKQRQSQLGSAQRQDWTHPIGVVMAEQKE